KYLAIGIGKWYKVFLVSLVLGLISWYKQKPQRFNTIILILWFSGFSIFLFSSRTEIWHLLPLYPVVALAIPWFVFNFNELLAYQRKLTTTVLLSGFLFLACYQFNQFSNLIYLKEP